MKYITAVLIFLLFSPLALLAQAYIYPDIHGDAVFGDVIDSLYFNRPFNITIMLNPEGRTFAGWSTPFELSGTGNVSLLAHEPTIQEHQMTMCYDCIIYESWDQVLPDRFSYAPVFFAPIGGETEAIPILSINDIELLGLNSNTGTFCIDSGDVSDDTYDWLFDPPVTFNGPYCWEVVTWPGSGVCGDTDDNGLVNIIDITYLIMYLYQGGPEPYNIRQADVNADCNVNIIDVTTLIVYLYMGGDDPVCPEVWPCSK